MSKFTKVGIGLGIFVVFIVVIGIIGSMIEKNDTAIQSSGGSIESTSGNSNSKSTESVDTDKQVPPISSSSSGTATNPASAVTPATQNARACTPGTVCFLSGDYLHYDTYKDGNLNWETRYTYTGTQGSPDDGFATVEKYDRTYDDNVKLVVGGKGSNNATTLVSFNLCCGLQKQEFIGGGYPYIYEVLQQSPVKIERWLQNPTGASPWKGKVKEDSYDYNGFNRSVIVLQDGNIRQVIDKETGIILQLENNQTRTFNFFSVTKLVDTNIINSDSKQ